MPTRGFGTLGIWPACSDCDECGECRDTGVSYCEGGTAENCNSCGEFGLKLELGPVFVSYATLSFDSRYSPCDGGCECQSVNFGGVTKEIPSSGGWSARKLSVGPFTPGSYSFDVQFGVEGCECRLDIDNVKISWKKSDVTSGLNADPQCGLCKEMVEHFCVDGCSGQDCCPS